MTPPALHVVTDDDVLARSDFVSVARALLSAHGPELALHVRGPGTSGRRLYERVAALADAAEAAGALLLVNDRVDVALAAGVDGVQLGRRSLPIEAARRLRPSWTIGASVHGVEEAGAAADAGADFLLLGTIWPTPSHPDRVGAGTSAITAAVAVMAATGTAATGTAPVVAIGGVTPERAAEARGAGAAGVAAIRGVWRARDAVAAAGAYIEAWKRAT